MNKIYVIATMVAATLLASCDNTIDVNPIDPTTGPQVQINFGTGGQTRAFFEESSAGEEWENEIKSLDIHVFDKSGKYLSKHSLTPSEIETKSICVTLPVNVAKTTCTFFAVANYPSYSPFLTLSEMDAKATVKMFHEHNGTFEEVSTGSKRPEGFVMTDKVAAAIAPLGASTTISLTLTRTVAKVALRVGLADDLRTAIAGGTFAVETVNISKTSTTTYLFPTNGYAKVDSYSGFTQVPAKNSDYYDALFYINSNDVRAEGERVLLTITGYFDADGDDTTTEDRQSLSYRIELGGQSSNGSIVRNGYYRVNATLQSLDGDSVNPNLAVANWATAVNQNENPGS